MLDMDPKWTAGQQIGRLEHSLNAPVGRGIAANFNEISPVCELIPRSRKVLESSGVNLLQLLCTLLTPRCGNDNEVARRVGSRMVRHQGVSS